MRLLDALQIIQKADATLPSFQVFLACGFTPLHLQTFLAASLQEQLTNKHVEIPTGIYGDLPGNISRMTDANPSAGAVVIEWQDLDPRLGIRRVSGWEWKDFPELAEDARRILLRLESLLLSAAERMRVVISFPTLPFPLLSSRHPATVSPLQAEIELAISETKCRLLKSRSIYLVQQGSLSAQGLDPAGEISFGFPYLLSHASELAKEIATVLSMPSSRKGIITDLDMTVWNGILGDDGIDGVHWDLDHHSQPHGLYQQLLHALSKEGVLVAGATKNSSETVRQLFAERQDMILKEGDLFPLVVSWQSKSEIIDRILKTWNIGAESVVFIDDNPFELEEVQRQFPSMECIQFDPSPRSLMNLWRELRMRFARQTISEEDRIRSTSIRAIAENKQLPDSHTDLDEFLGTLRAELKFNLSRNPGDERAFELINKTNQFNLNGVRLADTEFHSYLGQENSFLLTINYSDKFGALGKVSAMLGCMRGDNILVDSWVLSCRAFSHRIEFACLSVLFELCAARHVCLRWKSTERNSYLQEFLRQLAGKKVDNELFIDRDQFLQNCPALPYKITQIFAEGFEIRV